MQLNNGGAQASACPSAPPQCSKLDLHAAVQHVHASFSWSFFLTASCCSSCCCWKMSCGCLYPAFNTQLTTDFWGLCGSLVPYKILEDIIFCNSAPPRHPNKIIAGLQIEGPRQQHCRPTLAAGATLGKELLREAARPCAVSLLQLQTLPAGIRYCTAAYLRVPFFVAYATLISAGADGMLQDADHECAFHKAAAQDDYSQQYIKILCSLFIFCMPRSLPGNLTSKHNVPTCNAYRVILRCATSLRVVSQAAWIYATSMGGRQMRKVQGPRKRVRIAWPGLPSCFPKCPFKRHFPPLSHRVKMALHA
eukprot:1138212-Pelagomonas_calceolata.AAC.3